MEAIAELKACFEKAGEAKENHVQINRLSWLRIGQKCRLLRKQSAGEEDFPGPPVTLSLRRGPESNLAQAICSISDMVPLLVEQEVMNPIYVAVDTSEATFEEHLPP